MGVFGNRKTKPLPGTPSSTEGGPGIIDQHIQVGYNPGFYRSSPQWYPGENINTRNPTQNLIVVPETITDGINEDPNQQARLHYTFKPQPDIGGALNYSYDLYQLPLNNVCGPWMVAQHPTKPLGSNPTAFFQEAPVTSIGGLIPGQVVHQPLLDPNSPGSGFDYGW